jgi:hypothetical protein
VLIGSLSFLPKPGAVDCKLPVVLQEMLVVAVLHQVVVVALLQEEVGLVEKDHPSTMPVVEGVVTILATRVATTRR